MHGPLRFHPSAPVPYAEARGRHARVFSIARRLLGGETIEVIDRQGRAWRATASTLAVVMPGGRNGPTLQGAVAFDIAAELVALEAGEV